MQTAKQLMIAGGAPRDLFLTPAQRAKAWAGRLLTAPVAFIPRATRNEDAATTAFRLAEDERRRQKSLAGIARMKNRFAGKAIDHTRMRWDPRRCKFVPDLGAVVTMSAPAQRAPQHAERLPKREPAKAGADTVIKSCSYEPDDAAAPSNQSFMYSGPPRSAAMTKLVGPDKIATRPNDWSRVKAHNARALAQLNDVWDDKYIKLSGGLLVMSVTNRMKSLVKKGIDIKWI